MLFLQPTKQLSSWQRKKALPHTDSGLQASGISQDIPDDEEEKEEPDILDVLGLNGEGITLPRSKTTKPAKAKIGRLGNDAAFIPKPVDLGITARVPSRETKDLGLAASKDPTGLLGLLTAQTSRRPLTDNDKIRAKRPDQGGRPGGRLDAQYEPIHYEI